MGVHQFRGTVVFNRGKDEFGGCLAHFAVTVSAKIKFFTTVATYSKNERECACMYISVR